MTLVHNTCVKLVKQAICSLGHTQLNRRFCFGLVQMVYHVHMLTPVTKGTLTNKWQYLANALSNILCICLQTPHTYFSDEIQIYMEACTVQWFINEVIFVASLVSLIPFLNNFLVPNRSISAAYGLRNEIDIFVRQPMITHHTDSKNISTSSQLANRNSHHPHSWTQSQHKLTFSVWYVNFMFNFGQTLHVLGDLYTD